MLPMCVSGKSKKEYKLHICLIILLKVIAILFSGICKLCLALRHPLQPDDSLSVFPPTINACLTFSCSPCCLFGRSLFCLPTAFLEHTGYYKAKTSHIEQAKEEHKKSEKKREKNKKSS